MTFLGSPSRSDRLTPQKLSTSCRHSTPARISFGASCRIHAIRNFAFFDPRCKSGLQLGSEGPKLCPPRCDVNGMRQVSVVIDRNLHRQHHFPPSSIAPLQHLNLLSYPKTAAGKLRASCSKILRCSRNIWHRVADLLIRIDFSGPRERRTSRERAGIERRLKGKREYGVCAVARTGSLYQSDAVLVLEFQSCKGITD